MVSLVSFFTEIFRNTIIVPKTNSITLLYQAKLTGYVRIIILNTVQKLSLKYFEMTDPRCVFKSQIHLTKIRPTQHRRKPTDVCLITTKYCEMTHTFVFFQLQCILPKSFTHTCTEGD
jgi:hypothetical protein